MPGRSFTWHLCVVHQRFHRRVASIRTQRISPRTRTKGCSSKAACQYRAPMGALRRNAWLVFVLFAILATLFGVFPGSWFEVGVDREFHLLLSSYGALAVVLTLFIAVTAFRRGERWAWICFWAWPLFFIVHGLAFFVGDFVFAALGVAALAITRPRNETSSR
jgi:hypothetical protein